MSRARTADGEIVHAAMAWDMPVFGNIAVDLDTQRSGNEPENEEMVKEIARAGGALAVESSLADSDAQPPVATDQPL